MPINAPSLANLSLVEFGGRLRELKDNGVNFFHIDLMDSHYVPALCLPPRTVRDVKALCPDAVAEVHLMVDDPTAYLDELRDNGADWVSFHLDSTRFVRRTLAAIRERGMRAGVALNPSQPVELLRPVLPWLDYVVFMSVEPGFSGQRFLDGSRTFQSQRFPEIIRRDGVGSRCHVCRGAGKHDFTAGGAAVRPHVNEPVRLFHHIQIVLDDDDGIAAFH